VATTPKNNPERIRNTGKFQERVSEIRLSKPSAPKKVSAFEVPKAAPEASTLEKVGQFIEDRPMLKNTLDFLNAIGGAPAANFAANLLDRELNLLGKKSDIPFVPSFYDAYEGTKKYVQENFEDRPLGTILKAIPAGIAYSGSSGVAKSGIDVVKGAYAFGAGLRGIDPQTSKFLAEEAAKQYPKTATGLGLTFDLTADASNLFTLGSGSVAKAGAKAAQKTAMKVAKDAGVKVSKKDAVSKVADAVYNKKLQDLTSKSQNLQVLQRTESVTDPNKVARDIERITRDAIRRGIDPEKAAELARKSAASAQKTQKVIDRAETLAQQAKQKAQKKISDASRAAQAKAQNALISLDIPFTKFTMPLINKPKAFQKTYDTVGEEGIRIVKQLFTPPAGLDEKQIADFNNKVSNFLAETYGTSDPRKLTVEEIRDLQSRFERANITPSTTFDIEKKYVENIVDDIRKVESTNPFLFDEFLKTYSPETQQIAMGMLREGMTPQDIINQLPDILRQYAETARKRRVVPPQTEPLPKNIGDMLDELYYYDELSGRTTAPYEEVFNNILRLYNDPNVSRENLTKSLEETLQRARQSANEAEQTRFARETQEAQRIASENARLKTEFDEATRQYNIAFQNFKNSKATAKTDAEKAQTAQYEKLLKEWEDEVARIKALQKAAKEKAKQAQKETTPTVEPVKKQPTPKSTVKKEEPKPQPKQTPFEQAKGKNISDKDALLVDEYAHFLKSSGKSDEFVSQKVSSFITSLTKANADSVRSQLKRLIEEQKAQLSSNMPTGKKTLSLVSGQSVNSWKNLLNKIKSPDIANLIQKIAIQDVGKMVESGVQKGNDFRVATFKLEENGVSAFLNRRQKLIDGVVKALDEGASEADILAQLNNVRKSSFDEAMISSNADQIRQLIKENGTAVKLVDELKPVLPKNMQYKPPIVIKPQLKRGEKLTFKKPVRAVVQTAPPKPQPKRGEGLTFKKPEKVVEKIAEDLKPQPKRGEGLKFKPPVKAVEAPPKPQPKRGEGLKFKPPEKPLVDPKQKGADGFSPNLLEAINDGMSRFGLDLSDYFGEDLYAPIVKGYKKDYENQYVDFNSIADANRYYRIFEQGSLNDAKYFIHQEGKRVYMFPRDGKQIESAFKSSFPKEYAKSRMARLEQPKLKFKPPVKKVEAPEWAKKSAERSNGDVVHHIGDFALIRGYNAFGDSVFTVSKSNGVRTTYDIDSPNFANDFITPEQKAEFVSAKKKWLEADAKAFAENPNGPFKKGEIFAHSDNVPKEVQEIVKQWQKMLGITERIYLSTFDDAKFSRYHGVFSSIPSQALDAKNLGTKRKLSNGDFVIVYTPSSKSTVRTLETISHEIGHALMDTRYAEAPAEVRKAIDDEYEKWLASTKGKTAQELAESLRAYKSGKETRMREGLKADDINRYDYWKSKSEWFADQVSRWATTSEKPVSVVEKFFARLAKVMKQFFQSNKQYLASKTMEDWLNGLEESSKVYGTSVPPKPIVKTPEKPDIEYSKSNIEISSGNINIELPKRPKKKDIPLVIQQIEKVIKPTRPVYQKVPKVEPPKAVSLPTAKRNELRKLRENLQPTAKPEIINGLDRRFVSELKKVAAQLEKQKPEITTSKPENLGKMDIGTYKVKGKGKRIYRKDIPFYRLRQEGAFQRGATAVGPLSRLVRENKLIKMFSTRSLGTGNALVDSYGALLQDAGTRVSGESRFIRRDLKELVKKAEGLSPEQMKSVQYVVENRFPKAMTDTEKQTILDNTQIQEVADLATKLMAYIGKEDQAAGIVQNLRKDYFPHLMKFDADRAQEFADRYLTDPDLKEIASNLKKKTGFSLERRGLPTLAEYDDLVEELIKKRDAETDPTKIEEMDRKIEATTNLFNRDTVSVLNSRIYQSVRGRAMKDLYKQLEADGMIRYTWQRPENYVEISEDQAKILGYRPKTQKGRLLMHRDILAGMEQVSDIFTDQKMNTFVQTMDDIMRVWKLGTTVLIPKHYLNNLIGNAFNNGLAGVKVKSYSDALSFLRKMSKNQLSPEEQKMALQLYRDGVIGQGINAEFRLPESMTDRSTLQRLADWAQNTWYGRNVMHIGEAVDDWSRLALYMHMSKYSNSHQAGVDAVREYLFNYHEVTRADRFVRSTMMPFWLWMKNNIPLQVEKLLQQPRYFVAAEKIREATFEDDELQEKPEYIREKGFNLFGHDYVISLPMYDLYMVNGAQGTLKNILNSFGPLQTAIPELALNKDVFTSAPISKDVQRGREEDYTTTDIAKYLARQFGGYIGGEAVDYYQNVVEKERLTSAEQLERSLKGVFAPKPILEQ
jgi:hypothetical protein